MPGSLGFDKFAELVIEDGKMSLIHEGHKFIRDRLDRGRSYWRCRRSKCKARMVSKLINGYEMMKVRNNQHNHLNEMNPRARKKVIFKSLMKSRKVRRNVVHKTMPSLVSRPMPKLTPFALPNQPNKITNGPNGSKGGINSAREDNENMVIEIID